MRKQHNYREDWTRATNRVALEFNTLPDRFADRIAVLVSEIKFLKEALFGLTSVLQGESVCAVCDGACCNSGMYHFTVTDLVAYLSDCKELFTPDFRNGRCPYLGLTGCMMEPQYRPFNCITFNCELLEKLLPRHDVLAFYELEKELRKRYLYMENMFGNIFVYGLMSNYEKFSSKNSGILFPDKQKLTSDGGADGNYPERPGTGRN
jgi:hypothetical protein